MIFIDLEQDDSYITFWSQYPDLHDKAETLNVHSQKKLEKKIEYDIIEDEDEEANDNQLENDINNLPDMIKTYKFALCIKNSLC